MPVVHVGSVRTETVRGWPVVAAMIEADGQPFDVFFRVSRAPLSAGPEAFLAAALLPAMKLGADIHVDQPVAAHLLWHVDHIQSLACAWWKDYKRVQVQATPRQITSIDPQRAIGCFFSGGVDSFHTALARSEEISDLIFVHGLDIGLQETALRVKVARAIHQAADELGKPLIELETNVRDLLDPFTDWAGESDGAAMAAIVHVLSAQVQLVYLSGARAYSRRIHTGGANPFLLQLWTTPEVEISKAGRDVNRYEKVAYLANNDIAMRWLRVCWEHVNDDYNCGQCPKCLSTMLNLHLVGALDRCRTFNRPLDLRLMRQTPFGPSDRRHYEELLAHAEKLNAEADIIETLRACLGPSAAPQGDARYGDELLRSQRQVHHLRAKLARLRASRSMRLTAPLRAAGRGLRTLKERLIWKA